MGHDAGATPAPLACAVGWCSLLSSLCLQSAWFLFYLMWVVHSYIYSAVQCTLQYSNRRCQVACLQEGARLYRGPSLSPV